MFLIVLTSRTGESNKSQKNVGDVGQANTTNQRPIVVTSRPVALDAVLDEGVAQRLVD